MKTVLIEQGRETYTGDFGTYKNALRSKPPYFGKVAYGTVRQIDGRLYSLGGENPFDGTLYWYAVKP